MIITIGGTAGSGKSTVAKLLAKKLKFTHYSMGDLQRQIAEEKHISLLELSKIEEEDRSLDEEVDQKQIYLGKKEDNFVIDSRLGYHFIPNSVKVYLDADFEERANRIFSDRVRNELNVNLENTMENMKTREKSEKKRWTEYYHLDPTDKKQYDFVVDTTSLSPEQAVDKILEYLKNK